MAAEAMTSGHIAVGDVTNVLSGGPKVASRPVPWPPTRRRLEHRGGVTKDNDNDVAFTEAVTTRETV